MHQTDKTILKKGIKYLLLALPLLVLAPVLISWAALNKENISFWAFLIPGLITFFAAMYMIYIGVNTLMKALFSRKKTES